MDPQDPQFPTPPESATPPVPVVPAEAPAVPVAPEALAAPTAPQWSMPPAPAAPAHQASPLPAVAPPAPPAPPGPTAAYVREVFSSQGLITLAWIAGAVLVPALFSGILLLTAFAAGLETDLGGFGNMITGLLIATGISLGGGLSLRADITGFFEASGQVSAWILPLGAFAVVIAVVAVVARWRFLAERAPTLSIVAQAARAGVEAAMVALAMVVVTAIARFSAGSDFGGLVVRINAVPLFFAVLIIVAATLFVTRIMVLRARAGAFDGTWMFAAKEAARYLAVQFMVFSAVAFIALVVIAIREDAPAILLVGLPALGNAAAGAAALGQFGGLALSAGSYGSESLLAFDLPSGLGVYLIVIAVLTALATACFIGLNRQRLAQPQWQRVWQMPLIVFGVWALLSLGLAGLSARGDMLAMVNIGAGGTLGLLWSVPFLAAIFAGLVSVAAEFAPFWLYRLNPAALRWLGGRRAATNWVNGVGQQAQAAVPGVNVHGVDPDQPTTPAPPAVPAPEAPAADAALTVPLGLMPWEAAAQQPAAAQPVAAQPTTELPPLGAAALPPREPMKRKTKIGLIVSGCVVAGLGLLVAGTAVAVSMINDSRDPAATVSQYLELLEKGQADKATKLVDPAIKNSDREFLTDEVLGAAETHIEVVSVETRSKSDTSATVVATIALDGERFDREFNVAAGPKELMFLDTWELKDALVMQASVSGEGIDTLKLGDTEIVLSAGAYGGNGMRDIYVYPGIYTLTGVESEFTAPSTESLRITPDAWSDYVSARITVEPTEKFQEEILAQVQARITACVTVPTNMDEACPYVTKNKDLSELKVVTQPAGFESISLDRFSAESGMIAVRSNPGTFNKNPELRERDLSVSGEIEIVDGKPTVTSFWMY